MIAIINAKVVLENSIIDNGAVLTDGEKIVSVGSMENIEIPCGAEIIDAGGLYVGPGFVDIHVHGGGGHYFHKNPEGAAIHFLRHGETTVLPTLYIDLDTEGMLAAINRIKEARARGGACRNIGGIYMEGPYMNPKFGAMPERNKWRGEIRPEAYEPVIEALGTDVKVWAIAPEREGLEPFLKAAKLKNPSVMISVGHSEATPAEIDALKHYGIGLQTHFTDATGRPETLPGTRSCGPDEACLMDKDMYAEVICDSLAVHVHADMLKLVTTVKGIDKVVLISDADASPVPNPPHFAHIKDLSYDDNGLLCGSKLSQDQTCRNIIKHIGCSINDAFNMASRNPANVIGMGREIGTIAVGKRANLVIVDGDFNVSRVILEGEVVHTA